jgi:hypothetical protein
MSEGLRFPCPDCGTELDLSLGLYIKAADGSTGSVQAEIGDPGAHMLNAMMDDDEDQGDGEA